ncbi:MAG: pyridoxamine 5'-phosphate oxidase family protein [bacterium]|nr:pyridoxamine 5'-phosphate oxidase family protein [bacterium]
MMTAQLDDRLFEALKGEMVPKFLATQDESGVPNVVPIITIQPYDRETLIFGNFLMDKTEKNLQQSKDVSVTFITENLFGATIHGRFQGFQKVGEYADMISSGAFIRYNAYTGIRNAGSIKISDISEVFQLSKLDVLFGNLASKLRRGPGRRQTRNQAVMHPLVMKKFGLIPAVKVIAFRDDRGFPSAVPVMSVQPAAPDVLVFQKKPMGPYLKDLRENARVAACVITMEPVAFQVKGTYRDLSPKQGAIVLDQAFHASPPFVGKEIIPKKMTIVDLS